MKRCIVGALAALLMAAALITSAPPASAGCQYGGLFISKCDGPVQPDGTWQRCVGVARSDSERPQFLPSARAALRFDGSWPALLESRLRRPTNAHVDSSWEPFVKGKEPRAQGSTPRPGEA